MGDLLKRDAKTGRPMNNAGIIPANNGIIVVDLDFHKVSPDDLEDFLATNPLYKAL